MEYLYQTEDHIFETGQFLITQAAMNASYRDAEYI